MSATISSPEQRPAGRLGSRRSRRRLSPWLLLPVALLLAGGGYAIWQSTRGNTAAASTTTVTASRGTLAASVAGSGTVAASTSRALSFPVEGTVSEVLVAVGDTVSAGQELARIDTAELALAVQQAEADLVSAQAAVAAANGQGATPEELAAAQASLKSAQAQYNQTVNGDVSATDIASAQAQLASAQADLDELLAGATNAELAAAQAELQAAQLDLQSQRSSLSAAKSNAEGQVATAANALRDAQDAFSTLYWQNRQQEKAPGELSQSAKDEEAAAERAVADAEESLKQAQLAYEQAQQDEVIGVQQAEAAVTSAQRELDTLLEGASSAEVASARASVASAQANLAALTEGATAEERAIAEASLEQAELSYEELTAPGSAAEVASAGATLAQAEVALAQARRDLDQAALLAPFDGVVSEVLLSAGDTASAEASITVLDPSALYVELSLSESDVAAVAVGQQVQLAFDALPDAALTGTVTAVAPTATVSSNVATFAVRVGFEPGEQPVRVGMSASGTIITEQHPDALLVPSRAITTRGDASIVLVQQPSGQPQPVRVETGLSNDGLTEIVSCVESGDLCISDGDTLVVMSTTSAGATTTQTDNQRGTGGFGVPGGFGGGRP